MKFNYQARNKEGEIQSGIVEASNREAALEVLRSHDLYPIMLEEREVPFYARELTIFQKASRKDLVVFSRQLAIMLKSNVPIVESLRTIAKQTKKEDFKKKILKVAESIDGGSSFSEALAQYPDLFSPFYVNMVRAGEVSGKLTDIFSYLADYLEKEDYSRSKIKGAMIYPAFVLLVFFGVVSLIITYVIPQLASVLKSAKVELPLITRIVLAVSDFLRNHILLVVLFILLLAGGLIFLFKNKKGKQILGNYLLEIPLIGSFFKKYYLTRFALNLSTLISGGIPIDQALEVTADVVGNEKYKEIILAAKDGVKRGEKLSVILESYPKFITPLFYQMTAVGERTGNIDSSLKNIVTFYQREIDQNLESFIQLLEPLFIVVLGGVVGGLMAAVLIPLYSIGKGF